MAKYVKVEDVIELINGLDSLPWEEETEELVNRLPIYDTDKVITGLEVLQDLVNDNQKLAVMQAMDIVKAGGINGK